MENLERVTIGELAQKAGISRTTARRYAKDFGIYPSAGGARFRLYSVSNVEKMVKIKEMYLRGLSTREIKKALFGTNE